MLVKFSVSNFKSFRENFEIDFTKVYNYDFNTECIKNNCINNAIVYGRNGVGKSNLGFAIFDIIEHLTDKNKVYTYVISEVKVVQPTEVAVVDDTPGKSEVTLVTCTDAEATQRTIVKGELKSQVDFDKASSDIIEAFNKSYNQFQS